MSGTEGRRPSYYNLKSLHFSLSLYVHTFSQIWQHLVASDYSRQQGQILSFVSENSWTTNVKIEKLIKNHRIGKSLQRTLS